uniref:Uncharacterized protein n=1 Tax=Anguilla anguilla TaxID=7936 RepID=A0A0E9XBY6_ANGAN
MLFLCTHRARTCITCTHTHTHTHTNTYTPCSPDHIDRWFDTVVCVFGGPTRLKAFLSGEATLLRCV